MARPRKVYEPRPCVHCGSMFTPVRPYVTRRVCSDACGRARMRDGLRYLNSHPAHPGPCDDCGMTTDRHRNSHGRFCKPCAKARRRTHYSRKGAARRSVSRLTDITPVYLKALYQRTRKCPLCTVRLTDKPDRPNSKHLDHILPIAAGGTHTIGNVRIICRTCNLTRPHDGSDLAGAQLTLWAEDASYVARPVVARVRPTCSCGKSIAKHRAQCTQCAKREYAARGQQAAEMRAARTPWNEIADRLGFNNTGSAYFAAKAHGDPDVLARWPQKYEHAA